MAVYVKWIVGASFWIEAKFGTGPRERRRTGGKAVVLDGAPHPQPLLRGTTHRHPVSSRLSLRGGSADWKATLRVITSPPLNQPIQIHLVDSYETHQIGCFLDGGL